jgi:hypothetical protein
MKQGSRRKKLCLDEPNTPQRECSAPSYALRLYESVVIAAFLRGDFETVRELGYPLNSNSLRDWIVYQ